MAGTEIDLLRPFGTMFWKLQNFAEYSGERWLIIIIIIIIL
jgi:hypothetical protein